MPTLELKTSAYHEASHIVIAWHYGRRIDDASISKGDQKKGKANIIRLFGNFPHIPIHEIEREMDIAMAGIAAEEQLIGKKDLKAEWGGTDYPDAVEIAIEWSKKIGKPLNNNYVKDQNVEVDGIKGIFFQQEFFNEFGNNVRNLVSRQHIWKCVEAVANALLKHKELSREKIMGIISKAWKKYDGDRNEELIEKQKQHTKERPWGEWRPE